MTVPTHCVSVNAPVVIAVTKVHDDGRHNAFTDLCRFKGKLYLTFRASPTGHGRATDSTIVVLRSEDDEGSEWRCVHEFNVAGSDVRDPHLVIFKDRLHVHTTASCCSDIDPERAFGQNQAYVSSTLDGLSWDSPQPMAGTVGWFIWRSAVHDGKAYLTARRIAMGQWQNTKPVWECCLLASEDFQSWKPISRILENFGAEADMHIASDASMVVLARRKQLLPAMICRSRPPYREWTRHELTRPVAGPRITAWGEQMLVGGRKALGAGQNRTVISWLIDEQLVDLIELPSGGDTGYPGFVALNQTQGLLSYYSSHEGSGSKKALSAIYIARLKRP